jgi:hypothetical protein
MALQVGASAINIRSLAPIVITTMNTFLKPRQIWPKAEKIIYGNEVGYVRDVGKIVQEPLANTDARVSNCKR